MQHAEFKRNARYGPGGRNCPCCGPAQAERRKFDRTERRRMKMRAKKEIRQELALLEETTA